MPNPCSSGVGVAKPGAGAVAFLTNLSIGALLSRYGYGWLATIVTALPAATFSVDDFCTNGQPALPTITANDLIALTNPVLLADFTPAAQKVKDVALHYLWYELCDCATVATPAPTPPQTPPDVVQVGGATDECAPLAEAGTDDWNASGSPGYLFAGRWSWGPRASGSHSYDFPGLTIRKVRSFGTRARGATGVHDTPIVIRFVWASIDFSTIYATHEYTSPFADSWDFTDEGPGIAEQVQVGPLVSNINTADFITYDGMAYCDSLPSGGYAGCCPPDPSIAGAVGDLAEQLAIVKDQVDLIQRQAVPFAYIDGDVHNHLTGQGHIDVTGLIGIKIFMTGIPGDMGYEVGDTYEVFSDSWINWGAGSTFGPAVRLRGFQQFSFPTNAGLYTRISYTLRPGLEIAILELVREP